MSNCERISSHRLSLKKTEEDFIALTGKQPENITVVFLQVLKQMTENRFRCTAITIQPMSVGTVLCAGNDMTEQILAQCFQQLILCFKMSIECGTSHICPVNDFLYRDTAVAFFTQESSESLEYSCPCLLLTSVHDDYPIFEQFHISVRYRTV